MMSVVMKAVLAFMMICCGSFFIVDLNQSPSHVQASEEKELLIPEKPLELTIKLKRVYIDGEESEETLTETIWALEDFWAKYEKWRLVDMSEDYLVFEKKVNDISPLSKMNGYFGITEDGTLSIFNGKPEESDIIQSFFQIDVKKLESKQHQELLQGIPVKSKKDFDKVVETMKKYEVKKEL